MRCNYYNSYYIHALIKQRNKTNGSTQSCIFDQSSKHQTLDVPFTRRHVHTSDTDTQVHMHNRTATYMSNQNQNSSKHIHFYVGENIIIYTIIHMLLYVNLCRNMLRLNVIYSLWYSKMCSMLLSWEKIFIRRKALLTPNKFTQSANTSQGPYLAETKYKAWSLR